MKALCQKAHRYDDVFNFFNEYQGQTGRHKCAGCSFEMGQMHAMIGAPRATDDSILNDLPNSQAGTVRHKDAFEAYLAGYGYGLSLAMEKAA